jgi:hypothetical protein
MEITMQPLFSQLLDVVALKPKGFEAINERRNSVAIVFSCFVLIALLMTFGQLSEVSARVQKPDMVDFLDNLTVRFEGIGAAYPRLLGDIMDNLAEKSQEASAFIVSMQPPLGKDTSLIIRAVGRWLQTPLNLLVGWIGVASTAYIVSVFLGGKGSPREHISAFLLAALPLSLGLLNSLASFGQKFELASSAIVILAWVWSFAIMVRGMTVAHKFHIATAILITALAFILFEFSLDHSLGKSLSQFIFGLIF